MKRLAALAISFSVLMAQSDRTALHSVTAVRHWSLPDVTRVAVEVTGEFNFKTDRLHNPERVYFDILSSRPRFDGKRLYSEKIDDKLLERVRVAETNPGVTRVVLDLAGAVEVTTSQLANPHRLIVELRPGTGPTIPTVAPAAAPAPPPILTPSLPSPQPPKPPAVLKGDAGAQVTAEPSKSQTNANPDGAPRTEPPAPTTARAQSPNKSDTPVRSENGVKPSAPAHPETQLRSESAAGSTTTRSETTPVKSNPSRTELGAHSTETASAAVKTTPPRPEPPVAPTARSETAARKSNPQRNDLATRVTGATGAPVKTTPARSDPPAATTTMRPDAASMAAEPVKTAPSSSRVEVAEKILPSTESPARSPEPALSELGKAARHTSTGDTSLVRALGLKLGRVVIDPGHGGHDQGTEGAHGLLEKDLVLDVAKRVGKLVEDRLGAEVIYTRTDDTFIPLEGRTALANDRKADLFLSIHANSSPVPHVSGVETYYLNFSTSKDAMDVAARENATSQKSIFDLQDIVQKITLHDKAEESREFAGRVQAALFAFSSRNFPAEKNRGVRKAPFVVLIGATMPSVLAEIGFLSNAREESLLKKSDYRQKLAEALYRGISRYAETLSHFQVAKNQ